MWPTVQHKLEESFANYSPPEMHRDEENVLLMDEFVVSRWNMYAVRLHMRNYRDN